ncbi:MAG: hypothetical protein ACK559_00530, partial [bacterium]
DALQHVGSGQVAHRRTGVAGTQRARHAAGHRLVEPQPLPQLAHARTRKPHGSEQRHEHTLHPFRRLEHALQRGGLHRRKIVRGAPASGGTLRGRHVGPRKAT